MNLPNSHTFKLIQPCQSKSLVKTISLNLMGKKKKRSNNLKLLHSLQKLIRKGKGQSKFCMYMVPSIATIFDNLLQPGTFLAFSINRTPQS